MSTAQLDEKLDAILEALQGSMRPGSAPGLLQRMGASELDRAEMRRQIAKLTLAVRALEAAPGRAALSWLEKLALAILSLALGGLGVLVGRLSPGGMHP